MQNHSKQARAANTVSGDNISECRQPRGIGLSTKVLAGRHRNPGRKAQDIPACHADAKPISVWLEENGSERALSKTVGRNHEEVF
jgi:hypothetical protein